MTGPSEEDAVAAVGAGGGMSREVILRIVSGVTMSVVAAGMLFMGPLPFAFLVGAVALLASVEWARIVRGDELDAALFVHLVSVAIAALLTAMGLVALAAAVLMAGAILTGLLCFERRPILSAEGVLYAGLPAVALIWLRDDPIYGLTVVLFIILAVVATDVAAYATGRLVGGPKLAPPISPNKTWSGFIGGITAAGFISAGVAWWIGADMIRLGLSGLMLGIVAQIGDLTESALKRSFGVKDSGTLIPGHGGIMDRIDGLVFAAVAAGFVALAIDPQAPARALLFGG